MKLRRVAAATAVLALSLLGFGAAESAQASETRCQTVSKSNLVFAYNTPFRAVVTYIGSDRPCENTPVSLSSYATDGPTWPTSGTQRFLGHDVLMITDAHRTGTLEVPAPNCGPYQTDGFIGSQAFDGKDGALPHFPDSPTPTNIVASRNGTLGACLVQIAIPKPSVTPPTCKADGTLVLPHGDHYTWTGGESGYGPGNYNLRAVADTGYVFTDGQTVKTFTRTVKASSSLDCRVSVTPVKPKVDLMGCNTKTGKDTPGLITVTPVKGIVYSLGSVVLTDNKDHVEGPGTYTIEARATAGYKLADGKTVDTFAETSKEVPCTVAVNTSSSPTPKTPQLAMTGMSQGMQTAAGLGAGLVALGGGLIWFGHKRRTTV